MGEAELVAGFAAGEPGSVAEVYRRYGRLVYAVSYRVLGDANLAEDTTKQTFVRAWRLAGSSDPGRELGPWLAGIAARTAREACARRHSKPAEASDEPASTIPTPSPDQIRDAWRVRRALDTLPALDRELLRLEHDQRLTRKEISDQLGIPLDRMKSQSGQAHRRLAGLLGYLRADREAGTPSATEKQPEAGHMNGPST